MGENEEVSLAWPETCTSRSRAGSTTDSTRAPMSSRSCRHRSARDRRSEVVVELDGEVITRQPLVALEDVPEGGIWRQAVDTVLMMLE